MTVFMPGNFQSKLSYAKMFERCMAKGKVVIFKKIVGVSIVDHKIIGSVSFGTLCFSNKKLLVEFIYKNEKPLRICLCKFL